MAPRCSHRLFLGALVRCGEFTFKQHEERIRGRAAGAGLRAACLSSAAFARAESSHDCASRSDVTDCAPPIGLSTTGNVKCASASL